MSRAIALSLALLIGVGAIVPLATESVEAGKRKTKRYKKKHYKKYSKAWWRQYRANQRRKKAAQARRRALRLRQLRLARLRKLQNPKAKPAAAPNAEPAETQAAAMLPSGQAAPEGWRPGQLSGSEIQFSVDGGRGTAAISVVGPATVETVDSGRNRTLGGVPTSAILCVVINRMFRADIANFAAQQAEILEVLWRTLAPAGTMLYVTCSVFDEENAGQIARFCLRHADAERLPIRGNPALQLLPCADHDGFYYALLRKRP